MAKAVIETPIPRGGLGWSVIDEQEVDAVRRLLLENPDKLFRYQGANHGQCDLLERELEAVTGANHALFVSSGTAALTCCLAGLGIGPGDEVIVPAYTYIATAAAAVNVGAVPVIAEIDDSLGLDPEDFERKITPYTKAVICVHMQGVPCRLRAIRNIAKRHGIAVIEDCCQAIGAKYEGAFCGVHSDAFAWSTNFYKVLTCGEGGVAFCNDDNVFQGIVYQSDPAMQMWDTSLADGLTVKPFSRAGYRGNEIAAAVLRVQLGKLDRILGKTRALKKQLITGLDAPVNYQLQHVDDVEGDCGFSFSIIAHSPELAERMASEMRERSLVMGSVRNAGVPDRHIYANWTSILEKQGATSAGYPWKDPAYKGSAAYSPDMCPQTLSILSRTLRLGINMNMNESHIEQIAKVISDVDHSL